MKILVAGGGGREHALAWKLAQSERAERVFVAPGNAGCALERKVENVAIDSGDIDALADFAEQNEIGLTVIGPEAPLAAGVVDAFQRRSLRCFGPTRRAALLESSKSYCKQFLDENGIPCAAWRCFDRLDEAEAHIDAHGAPLVVKADGLAAGKGVVVARDAASAREAARDMLGEGKFGDAGRRVVIEELLTGEEASLIALVDGCEVIPLASSQDHKPLGDGDTGPNTGGMGACSPTQLLEGEAMERALREIIEPTVAGLTASGVHYRGFLYAGLMIDARGAPRVLEYNCRMGDPEAQPLLLRLRSDLLEMLLAACEGTLADIRPQWDERPALGVVLAAPGYPGSYRRGDVIGLPDASGADAKIFHAATAMRDGRMVSNGGRVLCATALGENIAAAQEAAYRLADAIDWPGAHIRRDIGAKAIARASGGGAA